MPLAEIVSEPDMRSADEAAQYGRELQKLLKFIGASDGAMAEGRYGGKGKNPSSPPHFSPALKPVTLSCPCPDCSIAFLVCVLVGVASVWT